MGLFASIELTKIDIAKCFVIQVASLFAFAGTVAGQSMALSRNLIEVEVAGETVRALLSPNEKQILWSQNDGGDKEVMIANIDGSGTIKLTDNRHHDYEAEWYPDGTRIVFCSTRSGVQQIYSMLPDGTDVQPITTDSNCEFGARIPRFSSAGHLAWQKLLPREGKINPVDLVVRLAETDEHKTLLSHLSLPEYSWGPDGHSLVVGSIGSLQFINVDTEKQKTIELLDLDERMNSYAPRQIQWNPEAESIACQINFVGGRIGATSIFGDHEWFVIRPDAEFEEFEDRESARNSHDWILKK